jgi:hypothetical protein
MDSLGVNLPFLAIQLLNLALLCGWPVLSVTTIFALRKKKLPGTQQALWVLIILAIPLLGALSFWVIQPAPPNGPSN